MFAAIPTLLAVQFFLEAADLRLAPDDPAPEEEGRIDFDLFGDTAASQKGPIDPALDRQVQARRSMLQTHQILGLGTLGLMAGNAVVGQLNYSATEGAGREPETSSCCTGSPRTPPRGPFSPPPPSRSSHPRPTSDPAASIREPSIASR